MEAKKAVEFLLEGTGITINGEEPWDIKLHEENFYNRVIRDGNLGLGESYMDGWWDCPSIDSLIYKILSCDLEKKYNAQVVVAAATEKLKKFFNAQSILNSKKDVSYHYDSGNVLFKNMLDSRMVYSCGYWKNASNLEEAQEDKLDLICKKIGLKPGMTLLDVGCGWGSFMKYAAEKYGAICTGITLSQEQINMGKELCEGLTVNFVYSDYRELKNVKFDRIVSVGMFEHVGPDNYRTYMKKMSELLKDDGLFLLHTIGGLKTQNDGDKWIRKYIFPHGTIPSIKGIGEGMEGYFYMEDWEDFGPDYDRTLMAWHENFVKSWDKVKEHYSETFKRMWEYYLLSCAGAFRSRDLALWQIVMTKKRVEKPICRV